MGIGFPIPLVMLDENELLGGHDIARIIGNFGMNHAALLHFTKSNC